MVYLRRLNCNEAETVRLLPRSCMLWLLLFLSCIGFTYNKLHGTTNGISCFQGLAVRCVITAEEHLVARSDKVGYQEADPVLL